MAEQAKFWTERDGAEKMERKRAEGEIWGERDA